MSGLLIALALVIAYLAHTYFFWRSGRERDFEQPQKQETGREHEHRNAYWHVPRTALARSHRLVHH